LYSFKESCGGSNAPAVTLVDNNEGKQNLLILCNDGFGVGPYSVQRVRNVDSVVANQEICPATVFSSSSSSNNNSLSDSSALILIFVLPSFFIGALMSAFVLRQFIKIDVGASMSSLGL
jgi:hypothetical protein